MTRTPFVFLLTDDLMTASRVQGAAAGSGVAITTVGGVSALLEMLTSSNAEIEASHNQSPRPFILIDLQTRNVDWAASLAELKSQARLLVFGPHVWKEPLELARQAGCDHVLTNGEFFANVEKWLTVE